MTLLHGKRFTRATATWKFSASTLSKVRDLPRLRLSSIDPAEPDAELMAVLADDPRLLPHLHLSTQHGDDVILKRMKSAIWQRYFAVCEEARRRRPDVVFGADVIAGFPTESDQAHQASLDMIEAAGITHLHVSLFTALRNSGPLRWLL